MKNISVRQFAETIQIRSHLVKRIQSHRYFPAVLITLVVLSAACVHVWQRVTIMGLVHEVALLEQEHNGLIDDVEKVESDIARLSMASRIEQYAMDSLGLTRVTPDRLYTLVPEAAQEVSSDELATMLSSIKRVADYLPVLTETQAGAAELRKIQIDDADREGRD